MSITNTQYRIYELSAIALMRNAKKDESGNIKYYLKEEATRKCISRYAPETQDDCALFYQTMCVLHNDDFTASGVVEDLKDIIIYVDFSNVFNRENDLVKYRERISKAEQGRTGLSPEVMMQLAEYFDVPLEYLYFGKTGDSYFKDMLLAIADQLYLLAGILK